MDVRIGLVGFYVKLYDDKSPEIRAGIDAFYGTVAAALGARGVTVFRCGICRLRDEFDAAIRVCAEADVDAIVTIHLAYSPSLESIESLLETDIPVIVLDTTPDFGFGPAQNPTRIPFNHGIHGVQDMCSLLVRNGKKFYIEAGHWEKSDVLTRVAGRARAISAASAFRGARIGVIGERFPGMGDFLVDPDALRTRFGIENKVFPMEGDPSRDSDPAISGDAILVEAGYYRSFMKTATIPTEVMGGNLRLALRLREWIRAERLDGFTFNFLAITRKSAIDRVPFFFAAVGMYEGLGYAGEGDVLTAALVGALLKLDPRTSFAEMFCPDWEGGTIFLSHMGEINPRVCPETAELVSRDNRYTDCAPAMYAKGQFMAGDALLVNMVPMAGNEFRLIVCPVRVEGAPDSAFRESVRGWIRPALPIADFLARYSLLGGTHHSALVYGERVETLRTFGEILGCDVRVIDGR